MPVAQGVTRNEPAWLWAAVLCCGLLVSGCTAPPPPQPIPPTEPVVPGPAVEPARGDATTDDSDAAVEHLEVDAAVPADADPADAGPADASAEEAQAPTKRARFHCFAWVHGPQASTDCFRTQWDCDYQRKKMKAGARDVLPACKTADGAWCTKVGRNLMKKSEERCFGSAYYCEQYASYVRGNGLVTTDCAER